MMFLEYFKIKIRLQVPELSAGCRFSAHILSREDLLEGRGAVCWSKLSVTFHQLQFAIKVTVDLLLLQSVDYPLR